MVDYSDPAPELDVSDLPEASLKEVVLLGLIAEEPSHAYGLEEKIRERRMTDWTDISVSSIYRVLSQLNDRGLIDSRLEHEGQGATRKVHDITAAGRRVLAEGVAYQLTNAKPFKNPFSVALAFLTAASYETVVVKLEERATIVSHTLEEIARIRSLALAAIREVPRERTVYAVGLELRVDLLFDHIEHHIRAEGAFLSRAHDRLAVADPKLFYSEESTAPQPRAEAGRETRDKVSK